MSLLNKIKLLLKDLLCLSFYFYKLRSNHSSDDSINDLEIILDPSLGLGDIVMFLPSISVAKNNYSVGKVLSHFSKPIDDEKIIWIQYEKKKFLSIFIENHLVTSSVFIPRLSPFLVFKLLMIRLEGAISINLTLNKFFSSRTGLNNYQNSNFIIMALLQMESILNKRINFNNIKEFQFKSDEIEIIEKFYLIAPSAHEDIRKLPIEMWNEISKKLNDSGHLVLIGSDKDRNENTVLFNLLKKQNIKIIDMTGKTSLANLVYLIKKCTALVCIDNGPFHLGRYLGKETISFFGPTDPSTRSLNENNLKVSYGGSLCPLNISPCVKPIRNQTCPAARECLLNQDVTSHIDSSFQKELIRSESL